MKTFLRVGLLSIFVVFMQAECCQAAASPVLLAAYQAWFGLPSHLPVYNSHDPAMIAKQIQKAKAMGIAGFVVDWYGPKAGVANDADREFIDRATAELFRQAEPQGFKIALMYDEGAIKQSGLPETQYMNRLQADLNYAQKYFSSSAYLNINDRPALFVFPYDEVDSHIDWNAVRSGLGTQLTLIGKNPNPDTLAHDNMFDGFYPWVQPNNWNKWDRYGRDWGEEYLKWFYSTMNSPNYASKIKVGGVWPGFDDMLASWGKYPYRFISRQNGKIYQMTTALAQQNNPPFILIETWNDFEEGTDIEFGVDMIVNMEGNDPSYPELLVRSSPVIVEWNPNRGELPLQVYKKAEEQSEEWVLIFDQKRPSGSSVILESEGEYAVKLWTFGTDSIIRKVKIRSQDPKKVKLPFMMLLLNKS